MPKYFYSRTKRIVDIPEDRAHIYDRRRWYHRLPEGPDRLSVPDGSVSEVLEWVGDDADRRRAALKAERKGKARVTLLRQLAENDG